MINLLRRRRVLLASMGEPVIDPYADFVPGGYYSSIWKPGYTYLLASPYFEVLPNTVYTVHNAFDRNTAGDYGVAQVVWFKSDLSYSNYVSCRNAQPHDATSPANAAYCRVMVLKSKKDECFFKVKSTGVYIFKGINVV